MFIAMAAGMSLFATSPGVFAKEDATSQNLDQDKDGEEAKSAFPSLDILPEGSILQRVRLPRYDKDFNPSSLLKADKLTVVDSSKIDGENVTIELYEKTGKVQAHVEMSHAIYDQKDSTLHANESITVHGESFEASGKGLVFHWHSKRGFLLGPATTEFTLNPPQPSTAMQLKSNHSSPTRALTGVLITTLTTTLTTSAIAEPPARLTETQLTELDQLVQTSEDVIQHKQAETTQILEEEKQEVASADKDMGTFLKGIGQGSLLVKNTAAPQVNPPSKKPTQAQDDPQAKDDSQGKKDATTEPPQLLKVECDGGLYFDTDTGILAYLKNVRLTETRFKLSCSQELKVFLDQKPEDPQQNEKNKTDGASMDPPEDSPKASPGIEAPKTEKVEEKKEESLAKSFGDLKRIVAIGQVRVVSKDEKGKIFIATAETASYDAKTGEMILRGGLPRIQYGPNQYLASQAPGQYIRMLKNGKLVTTGKWAMQIDTSQTKSKSSKPKEKDKSKTP